MESTSSSAHNDRLNLVRCPVNTSRLLVTYTERDLEVLEPAAFEIASCENAERLNLANPFGEIWRKEYPRDYRSEEDKDHEIIEL